MSTKTLTETQFTALNSALESLISESEARGAALCDSGGNILSSSAGDERLMDNVAALAAGSFAATRELADIIGEPGFRSIFHRGQESGILIYALNEQHLVVVILGKNSFEGLVRLCLKKTANQLKAILEEKDAGSDHVFEAEQQS